MKEYIILNERGKTMREQIIEMIKVLNDKEFDALISGINQITCEYGWAENLDNSELIKTIWKYEG